MKQDGNAPAPLPSVRRLPMYLRVLKELADGGRDVVSCTYIAGELGLTNTQVRKDLAVTGIVGKPKVGYGVPALMGAIEGFLGWDGTTDAFLVGAGSLGSALLGYEGFGGRGLRIVAAFDKDPGKIGRTVHGREILPLDAMMDFAERMHARIGIVTVPAAAAQDVANCLILSGIEAIWNFTAVKLEVPSSVIVEDVRLSASLAVLSSRLAQRARGTRPGAK